MLIKGVFSTIISPAAVVAASLTSASAETIQDPNDRILIDKATYAALEDTNKAYIRGVLEIAEGPVLFVDPDKIDPNNDMLAGRQLAAQLESQIAGVTEALQLRAENFVNTNLNITTANIPVNELARDQQQFGPSAISGIEVNGQQYAIVTLLSDFIDDKEEIVTLLSGGFAKASNVKGSDNDWARLVGQHEGSHTNRIDYGDPTLTDIRRARNVLEEEVIADNDVTITGLKSDWQDVRHLSSGNYFYNGEVFEHDTVHATGRALSTGEVTKIDVIAARQYKENVDIYIEDQLPQNDDRSADDILEKTPELFFDLAAKSSEKAIFDAIVRYKETQSFQDLEKVIIAQAEADYRHAFEGAYRRLNLGQDIALKEPPRLIPSEYFSDYQSALELGFGRVAQASDCESFSRVTAKSGLKIRKDADQDSTQLPLDDNGRRAVLNYGDIVQVHQEELSPFGTEWKFISSPTGRIGYVSGNFLQQHSVECKKINIPEIKF